MAHNPFDPMAHSQMNQMNPMNPEVAHNQRMADVMRMNTLQPLQNISASPLGEVSPFQALAQVMSGYVANKYQDKATDFQAKMVQAIQANREQGLANYKYDLENDRANANTNALAHPDPLIQAIGKLGKRNELGDKDYAERATNESVFASGGNPTGMVPQKKTNSVAPGHLTQDAQTGEFINPVIQPGAGQTLETINGDLYGRTATGIDQISKAPRVTTNTTVNNNTPVGETEFEKAFGRKEGSRLSEDLQQRTGRIEGINAATAGIKLLDEGIHTGLFADMKKNLDKGYGAIAGKEPEKAARTEQFISHIGNLVIPRLKDFGGSDTVEEMNYLKEIMAGKVSLEAHTLRKILNSVQDNLTRRVKEVDDTVEAYRGRGKGLPTIDRGVQQPATPSQSNGVMSPEDYLKQFAK